MGAAMGALFFSLSIGTAISPAILGSTMNVSYTSTLDNSIPEGLSNIFLIGAIMVLLAFLIICTIPGKFTAQEE